MEVLERKELSYLPQLVPSSLCCLSVCLLKFLHCLLVALHTYTRGGREGGREGDGRKRGREEEEERERGREGERKGGREEEREEEKGERKSE